jgi:hypothetical protein
VGWRVAERGEISLAGQNLFRGRHREFNSLGGASIETTQMERSGYVKLTWAF